MRPPVSGGCSKKSDMRQVYGGLRDPLMKWFTRTADLLTLLVREG